MSLTRRFLVKTLGAVVLSASAAMPMLNRRQALGGRPWTPETPLPEERYEVLYAARPKNFYVGAIAPFSISLRDVSRTQLQIPMSMPESERRRLIAEFYGFPVERFDMHAPMFGIRERCPA